MSSRTFNIMSTLTMNPSDLQHPTSPYILPAKLWFDDSGTNFPVWKAHLVHLYRPHGLLGFLDGSNPCPPETIINPCDCCTIRNPDYDAWMRTDQSLKERISSLLNQDVARAALVNDIKTTSRDIWSYLDVKFQKHLKQLGTGSYMALALVAGTSPRRDRLLRDWNDYSQLCAAVQRGNWTAAEQILINNPSEAIRSTGLRMAVGAGERASAFVTILVARMSDESVSAKDAIGNTALSIAAAAGNTAAATLVNKNRNLLYIPNILGEFPAHIAAKHAKRDALVYLLHVTNDAPGNPYTGLSGFKLLMSIIQVDYYDIALNLVKKYPYLARLRVSDNSALKSIAQRRYSSLSDNKQKQECIEFVKFLCMEMKSLNVQAEAIYHDAILIAAKLGNHEIFEVILEAFPDAIYCSDSATLQNIAHVAVENHSQSVFKLICNTTDRMHLNLDLPDVNGNNLLHLAAKLMPSGNLVRFSNAVARMQHEEKWFKTVENVVHPLCKEQLNKAGKSPKVIFREEHSELRKAGEQWMKNTAFRSIIIAVLISTVTFAAAVTVPGGNDSSSGFPLFSRNSGFIVFAWFDSIAFLLSIISLLIFLYISLANYADEDLKVYNPLIFTCGVYSLYFSICMLAYTFFVVITLVFGQAYRLLELLLYAIVASLSMFVLLIIQRVLHDFDFRGNLRWTRKIK